ncbi:MAG: RNA methyltransferase [Rhizobiales bacterium]|nr:RNA methyltransferase [Hyphomicrobiales bacterium]
MADSVIVNSVKPCIILVNPQLGENIGTAARAMANFGLGDMRIVDPRDGWPNIRAREAASGADWVIEGASVHDGLAAATGDLHHIYATTARPRDMVKPVMSPEEAAADMTARMAGGQSCGIAFGRERWGLNNDEIALCDTMVMAPVDPEFASLNIAQAVLLVSYEWYKLHARSLGMSSGEAPPVTASGLIMPDTRPANKDELAGFFKHLEGELDTAGFFKSRTNRPTMIRNLRNMFHRASLTEQEVRTLRGVISSLVRHHLRPKPNRDKG